MTFRILSLDGGGPWALLQAMALARLYPGLDGHAILGRFDLAIANSGGSITLAGLAMVVLSCADPSGDKPAAPASDTGCRAAPQP